ncbi:MAG: hypothetical protein AABM67_12945 [Acidobacteriota bacterium]
MIKVLVLLISLVALAVSGCGKGGQAGLGQFVGTWQTTYSIFDSRGGRVSSGKLTVKQPSSDTVTFGESTSVVTGVGQFGVPNMQTKSFDVTLKHSANNYLLTLKVDGEGILDNFPLTYSESGGFNGQGSVAVDGKQTPFTASIKKDGAGSVWKISADEGSGPKHLYEFSFKEKS